MKIRIHKGSLDDSLATTADIEPTPEAVRSYLLETWGDLSEPVSLEDIEVTPYDHDDRIEWDAHLVTLAGRAVAFTDGPLA